MMLKRFSLKNGKKLETPTIFLTFDLGQNYLFNCRDWDWKFWKEHVYKLNKPRELNFLLSLNSIVSPPHPPDYVDIFTKYINPTMPVSEFCGFRSVSDSTIWMLDCDLRISKKKSQFKPFNLEAFPKNQLNPNVIKKLKTDMEEEIIQKIFDIVEKKEIDMVIAPYYKIHPTDKEEHVKIIQNRNLDLIIKTIKLYQLNSKSYSFDLVIPIQLMYNFENPKIGNKWVDQLKYVLNKLKFDASFFAYGGKLGFPKNNKNIKFDLFQSKELRKKLGQEILIHCLGAGAATTGPLYILNGFDSGDSNSWSIKGGNKKVVTDLFTGEKRVMELKTESATKKVPEVDFSIFSCDCPICFNKKTDEIKKIFIESGRVPCRIHNAWMIYKSIWELRILLQNDDKKSLDKIIKSLNKILL